MAQVLRGGFKSVEFNSVGETGSPAVYLERLYGQIEFDIADDEQEMADGTIAQAGVRATATIRDLDLTPDVYADIKTATENFNKMDVTFNSLIEGKSVTLHNCSVRYSVEPGAAGDFFRSRVIANGFAHNIDDILTVTV